VSGIAAIVNLNGSAVRPADIERLANVLKPYGPDRRKVLFRGNAGFVFCLHQLTPEDVFESQPLVLANRFVILFDGRIDNRSELAAALGIGTSDLQSMPDSMIVLRLFNRWGERAFERIVGVFAIIIMDLKDRSLICARDHMGLRVLHYHRSADQFAVATTPEALFALSWVPRILNKDKVADTLVDRGWNHETTYYQEIFRVLPGSIIRLSGARFSKESFWDPEKIANVRFKTDQDYVEAFQERLNDAVRSMLRSRKTPCASITGGLDSSSIAVIAADMLAATGKTLHTFTAVPEAGFIKEEKRGCYYDETPYVRQIAEAYKNIIPHFVPPNTSPILEQIAKLIQKGAAPSCGVLNDLWGMDMLGAARSAGHSVMLSGEMGNHTMSDDGRTLFAELLLTGRWFRLMHELMSSGYRWRHILRHCTIAPMVPAPLFRRYKQWRRGDEPPWYHASAIHPEFAARSGVVDRAARENAPFDAPPARNGRLGRIRSFNSFVETADWFAQIRANFGIDVRTPAFDLRIVEFCVGIPEDQYLRNGCNRWLIRRAMKGRLPHKVLANTKHGLTRADWFPRLTRERSRIMAEVKRLSQNSEVASIIDLERLKLILKDWPDSQPLDSVREEDPLLWALPQALGAAHFIENVTRATFDDRPSLSPVCSS
jgi:asparagine synthase (glutamine-hydrolysing)